MNSVSRLVAAGSLLLAAASLPLGAVGAAPRGSPLAWALDSLDARLGRAQYLAAESLGVALLRGVPSGLSRAPSPRDSAALAERVLLAMWRNHHEGRPEFLPLAARALAIREAERPPDSLALATALEGMAYARTGVNDAAAARALGDRVLALRRPRLPAGDPGVSRALHNLGSFAYRQGRYGEAQDFYRQAVEARVRSTGEFNPEVANSLNGLAASAFTRGDYALNDSVQRRILAIRRRILPPGHPDIVASLTAISAAARMRSDATEAESYAEQAVATAEARLAPDDVQRAWALERLADVRREQGDYARSRTLEEGAVAILERNFGPDGGPTLLAKHSLYLVLIFGGDYDGALRLARERLAAHRKRNASADNVGDALDDVAWAQFRMGAMDSALANEREAVALVGSALGPTHRTTVSLLTNQASMEAGAGHFERADSLYGRTLELKAKRFGPDAPELVNALEGQGASREGLGRIGAARECFERARTIAAAHWPADHPYVGLTIASVARIDYEAGLRDSALPLALRAERIGREHFQAMAGALSEREALRYAATRVAALDLALTYATDSIGLGAEDRRATWDALVRSRGLVLEAMIERRRLTRRGDPETERVAQAVREAREARARAAVGARDSAGFARLDSLRGAVDRAERALAARSEAFGRSRRSAGAGFDQVAAALPPGATLVAYVRFERGLDPRTVIHERVRGVTAYGAFVLRAGETEPAVVALGDASAIEPAIAAWARALATPPPSVGAAARAAEAECRTRGAAVRRAVWDPLVRHLGAGRLVLVVPDGVLHTVPLAALPDSRRGYLVESGRVLHVLTTERDVLPAESAASGAGLFALGGPDFDRREGIAGSPLLAAAAPSSGETYRGVRPGCEAFARLRFSPLPGAAEEIGDVAAAWRDRASLAGGPATGADTAAVVATGTEAGEAAFKRLAPGRRVVHLATHGFFLDLTCAGGAAQGTRGVLGLAPAGAGGPEQTPPPGENPLLLSGLALAGANGRNAAGPGEEDGVLTADEIAALDLSGLEWAVLSACGTGLGEVAAGEGVLGLRRAFLAAGARTVFTSLWSVRDQPTREWMAALYHHHLVDGAGAADAARAASLDLLRSRRAQGRSTHPFEWAAFLPAGDWR